MRYSDSIFSKSLSRGVWGIALCSVLVSSVRLLYFELRSGKDVLLILLEFATLSLISAMIYWFSKKVLQPVKEITKAANHISKGNFTDSLNNKSMDEIGDLAESVNKISSNLKNATQFVTEIASGKLDSEYAGINEEDKDNKTLPGSLVHMRDQMKRVASDDRERSWVNEGLAKFAEILRANYSLDELSKIIVKELVQYVGLNQGGLFLLKESNRDNLLELKACYAFSRHKYIKKEIEPGDGLLGQAFLEGETVYMTDIPDDYVELTSGLGSALPKVLLMVPLKINEEVHGMLELAGFHVLKPFQISFIEKVGENMAASISSVKINEQTRKLLIESQQLTASLKEQEEELRQNAEEMQATQEEVNRKFEEFNKRAKFDQLTSIRSAKKRTVEEYFSIIRNQIASYAEDKMIIDAMKAFKSSFVKVAANLGEDAIADMAKSVKGYYNSEYLPRLNANSDLPHTAEEFWTNEPGTVYLQHAYIAGNPFPTGKKSLLDFHKDDIEYNKAHAMYHPVIRNFLDRFGYYDIFLVDNETGHIVYSVFKEADYATSLITGPYKHTNFGRVFREAAASTDKGFVRLVDFESYNPSYTAPASFIATSIYDENDIKIGVLVFQMPVDKINIIMTGGQNWTEDGLGRSGETYIVGEDYKMRSMSRFLIEDSDNYFKSLSGLGYNQAVINKIKRLKTCILLQDVETDAVKSALRGVTGIDIVKDYRGIPVLSSFTKLNIQDVNWVILSDIDEEEVNEVMKELKL